NERLKEHEWLAGQEYTIADMATYPWARAHVWAKVSIEGLEHLQGWFDRLDARPMVQKALTIPKAQPAFWGAADESEFLEENAARFASDVKR
ncbi:MAG: glutathione binding-like protein, partial [Pseudomonadota bacterium]